MYLLKLFLIVLLHSTVKCANILYLVALPSPSHHIWNRELINSLASNGHNVTVLAPDFDKISPERVHYYKVDEIYDDKVLFNIRKEVFKINATDNYMTPIFDMKLMLNLCEG